MGLGVRQIEGAAEHVADLVVQARARGGESHRREIRAVQRLVAAVDVLGIGDDLGQAVAQRPDAFGGQRRVNRVGLRPPEGIDAVGHAVEPGGHGHLYRQREHERGVVDHGLRQHAGVHAGGLAPGLGQAPDVGGLGAGVGGGHRDDGDAGGQRHCLGQSGGGAAADAD